METAAFFLPTGTKRHVDGDDDNNTLSETYIRDQFVP